MIPKMMCSVSAALPWLLLALPTLGCGDGVETAPVSGVVSKDGQPLDQVMVFFLPDPKLQTEGSHSTAITDEAGRYELSYYGDQRRRGAVIGHHRVTLEDMNPQNHRGDGPPPRSRIPKAMSEAWQTPLRYEVTPGPQEINIDLDGDSDG